MMSLLLELPSIGETSSEERDITLLYRHKKHTKRFQYFIQELLQLEKKKLRFFRNPVYVVKLAQTGQIVLFYLHS